MTRLALALLIILHINYDTGVMTIDADLGWEATDKPESLAAGVICKHLTILGQLDHLPVPWIIETHVPRPSGAWVPDPTRRKTGILTRC